MSIYDSITRKSAPNNNITTKGKIIDVKYEVSICKTEVVGVDLNTGKTGIDGYFYNPGFTKSQWLNCQ